MVCCLDPGNDPEKFRIFLIVSFLPTANSMDSLTAFMWQVALLCVICFGNYWTSCEIIKIWPLFLCITPLLQMLTFQSKMRRPNFKSAWSFCSFLIEFRTKRWFGVLLNCIEFQHFLVLLISQFLIVVNSLFLAISQILVNS